MVNMFSSSSEIYNLPERDCVEMATVLFPKGNYSPVLWSNYAAGRGISSITAPDMISVEKGVLM
jgi:hypothetical protein